MFAGDCVDDGRAATATLHIEGGRDRAVLTSGDRGAMRVEVRALGTSDAASWLLDSRLVSQVRGDTVVALRRDAAGDHELTAVAESGAWARIGFRVLDRQLLGENIASGRTATNK